MDIEYKQFLSTVFLKDVYYRDLGKQIKIHFNNLKTKNDFGSLNEFYGTRVSPIYADFSPSCEEKVAIGDIILMSVSFMKGPIFNFYIEVKFATNLS